MVLTGAQCHICNGAFDFHPSLGFSGSIHSPTITSVEHRSGLKTQQFVSVWLHKVSQEEKAQHTLESQPCESGEARSGCLKIFCCLCQMINGRNYKTMPTQPNIPEYLCDVSLRIADTLTPLPDKQSELFSGQYSSPVKLGLGVTRLEVISR